MQPGTRGRACGLAVVTEAVTLPALALAPAASAAAATGKEVSPA